MPLFGAYGGSTEMSYLFVDLGCLREALKQISMRYFGNDSSVKWSPVMFRGRHDKVFVYDAVPAQRNGESHSDWHRRLDTAMAEVKRIRAFDCYHVPLGDLRGKKVVQKKVDVMIAVDMLMHTMRGNMHSCTLLTGDSDFQPLLEALTREGMVTTLWCPSHAPDDLRGAADSTRPLDILQLGSALLRPDGSPLAAAVRTDVRNPQRGPRVAIQEQEGKTFELSHGANWTVERYDPQAYAVTDQVIDRDPRIAIMYAEDMWQNIIPDDIKSAAGC